MASMGIGGMGRLYGSNKKKSKPCPSKKVAKEIDRDILRSIVEGTEEVCENTTATRVVDEPYCEEVYDDENTTCDASVPSIPQEEGRTIRMKVPRGISRFMSDSPCGDSDNTRGTLEDWDMHGIRLAGRIYEDKRGQYPDGEMIYTETVKSDVSELKEGAIIRTRNNYYLLGKRHVPNDE